MTEKSIRWSGSHAGTVLATFLVLGGVGAAVAAPGLPGTGDWGCCPGCMNGGPMSSDGTPLAGAPASSSASPAAGAALARSGRDRRFDLYARPPSGDGSSGSVLPAPVPAPAEKPAGDAAVKPEIPKPGPDGVTALDFSVLAGFDYIQPATAATPLAGIPKTVGALDGRRVRVTGFLLPVQMEGGLCRQFLILRNQMACCYGVAPAPTEWIVATSAKGVDAGQDLPLNFTGTLRVGARFEKDVFTGVYALEVDDAR